MKIDTLIVGASELVTLDTYGGQVPLRGKNMREIGAIENGAVAISGGKVAAYGEPAITARVGLL